MRNGSFHRCTLHASQLHPTVPTHDRVNAHSALLVGLGVRWKLHQPPGDRRSSRL